MALSNAPSTSSPVTRSFRDPGGRLYQVRGRIIRTVNRDGWPDLSAFLASGLAGELERSGRLVHTTPLGPDDVREVLALDRPGDTLDTAGPPGVVEHERIPFPSFPYEWPPEMLHEAARLTLDLAEELLAQDYGLKDGTPYNILFRGPEPVFVDVLSVERRDPGNPTWLAYAQFVRTFLLPLLANRLSGLPLESLLAMRRDGLEPADVYRLAGPVRRLLPPLFSLVTMPLWLGAAHNPDDSALYRQKSWADVEKARFVLRHMFRGLRRHLRRVAPPVHRASPWSDYMHRGQNSYSELAMGEKEAFVRAALDDRRPGRVLDVGCNTGHFSAMAARTGASVVAIDSDPVVVGQVWQRARSERLDILPLVVDLARPTPAIGWRNQECPAFLDRARGGFDCVLMLAVIHHMLVTERVPLPDILALAAELTTDLLVIEFVAPDDSMFRRLTRGRAALFTGLTTSHFERACEPHFEIVRSHHLEGTSRWLYLLRRAGGSPRA